jgi:rSAM/selenodomain-associated transferase 1
LVPPLSFDQAAELSRALLVDQLESLTDLRDIHLYLAFAPENAAAIMKTLLPPCYEMFLQIGHDLGARMENCLAELRQRGHRNILLIGGDLPPLPLDYCRQAFDFLRIERHRVVLGPSRDGGYYLVGMNGPVPELFSDMCWSHDRVLAQTTERLNRLRIEFTLLPPWFDVDCAADLDALQALSDPVVRAAMKQTHRFLKAHLPQDKTA